ncbi:MAG: L-lactate permease [Cytophagales bacterium]|nr:L-lactate permease [Bernardetiaceae bacterium]MDW8205721.1 L-lactate permease [Cytophagales bacterium]
MSPSLLHTLLALLLLLGGIFLLRRLWLGALAGILFLSISRFGTEGTGYWLPILTDTLIIWVELGLLIFGAYLFYNLLRQQPHITIFSQKLGTAEKGLAVILLFGWFLGSLMEGIAGFGIPAMLIAPLLYRLGFRALTCVIIPLAANTASVTFGALATPLRVGIGIVAVEDAVAQYTVLFNSIPIVVMPFVLAWLYSKTEQRTIDWHRERQTLLLAGICFLVPYWIGSRLSIELPTVLAGGIGMIAFVALVMPHSQRPSLLLWWRAFGAYLLFIALLIVAGWLLKPINWQWWEGSKKLSAFQPGIVFIVAALIYRAVAIKEPTSRSLRQAFSQTVAGMRMTLLSILLLILFTQLIRTGMIAAYSDLAPQQSWMGLVVFSGLSGVVGSFITGSATMGNLLFAGGLKQLLAGQLWLSPALAALHSGSAVGNAISLQNILMVKSVIPQPIEEGQVMQLNAPVVVLYLLLVCISAWIVLSFF